MGRATTGGNLSHGFHILAFEVAARPVHRLAVCPAWLVPVFERMGSDPATQEYIRPAAGDVCDFVGPMKQWATGAGRRGIPNGQPLRAHVTLDGCGEAVRQMIHA